MTKTATSETAAPEFVKVTIGTMTGEETIDVPKAATATDETLRALLAQTGVDGAANARIEPQADGSIKLIKQASSNG